MAEVLSLDVFQKEKQNMPINLVALQLTNFSVKILQVSRNKKKPISIGKELYGINEVRMKYERSL